MPSATGGSDLMGRVLMALLGMGLLAGCGDDPPPDETPSGDTTSAVPQDAGIAAADTDTGTPFTHLGACGMNGEARVSSDRFEGVEEYYLIGDEGMGEDLCRIRFDVVLVGESPVACDICTWALIVERRNPVTVTDEEGACARSELGLDAETIDALDGTRTGYGYVPEYVGHSNVLMQLDEETGIWEAVTFAAWDEETAALYYDRSDGACGY